MFSCKFVFIGLVICLVGGVVFYYLEFLNLVIVVLMEFVKIGFLFEELGVVLVVYLVIIVFFGFLLVIVFDFGLEVQFVLIFKEIENNCLSQVLLQIEVLFW